MCVFRDRCVLPAYRQGLFSLTLFYCSVLLFVIHVVVSSPHQSPIIIMSFMDNACAHANAHTHVCTYIYIKLLELRCQAYF